MVHIKRKPGGRSDTTARAVGSERCSDQEKERRFENGAVPPLIFLAYEDSPLGENMRCFFLDC